MGLPSSGPPHALPSLEAAKRINPTAPALDRKLQKPAHPMTNEHMPDCGEKQSPPIRRLRGPGQTPNCSEAGRPGRESGVIGGCPVKGHMRWVLRVREQTSSSEGSTCEAVGPPGPSQHGRRVTGAPERLWPGNPVGVFFLNSACPTANEPAMKSSCPHAVM